MDAVTETPWDIAVSHIQWGHTRLHEACRELSAGLAILDNPKSTLVIKDKLKDIVLTLQKPLADLATIRQDLFLKSL